MILSDVETLVRTDLFDLAATRWTTADIDRAIDRAIDKYTAVYPNTAYSDMACQPYQRTYPYPASWNSSYPVQWIERILYPLQVYGSQFAVPTSAPAGSASSGGSLGNGTYKYVVTYITQGGETPQSSSLTVNTSSSNKTVNLTSIPIASGATAANSNNYVIGRSIYRTLVGGSVYYYLSTITDNTTTTYTDSAADSTLSGMPQPPSINTSGTMQWPPQEREFAEFSNLFDSSSTLAAGGNLGIAGAVGSAAGTTGTAEPTFTLKISGAELPIDTTQCMRIFYATKHQLDSSGSTIPEIHRDIITCGACAYAMEAYQAPSNDNFHFQDGAARDMMDDTAIPGSWLSAAKNKMQQFEEALSLIKRQRDFAYAARVQWGNVPVRWNRL
jgi:hypothetical protein